MQEIAWISCFFLFILSISLFFVYYISKFEGWRIIRQPSFFNTLISFYSIGLLKSDNEFFEKAEHYIKLNIHNNIKVQDVADALNIDRSYFTKIFKNRFRTSPHEYIIRLRLREAEILLTSSNYTISQIAEQLNFSDVFSFSKCFKRQYKQSPSQLRKDFISSQGNKKERKAKKTEQNP